MASVSTPGAPQSTATEVESALEIRAARPEEREQAWSLQRAAFNLPEREVPHPGSNHETWVAVRCGRVVSCLTLIYAGLSMRGARLEMGGVRHVATHPDEQNRGYASALMRCSLRRLREQGVPISVLFPFSFRYYRKFGYELGGNHCQFWCRPNCIPAFSERRGCRTPAPEEAPFLSRFHEGRTAAAACAFVRDERRWRALCADPNYRVVVYGGTEIDGFAVLSESRDAYGGRVLRVLDLASATSEAWRGLLGYLSQMPVESVEWLACAGELASSGLLRSPAPLREGFKPRGIVTVRPMFQVRVVDLPGALRARAARFPAGRYRLALRIQDDLLAENARPITIQAGAEGVDVRRGRPTDPYLETDVRVFSQVFCGYMSPADAVSQGLARCSSPAALDVAEQLFAAGEPFISELDRF